MPMVRDLASRPIVLVALLLCLSAAAPACQAPSARPSVSAASSSPPAARSEPAKDRATGEELARYAERERSAAGLEKFQGGRIDTGTIIIVLLLVIVIILIV